MCDSSNLCDIKMLVIIFLWQKNVWKKKTLHKEVVEKKSLTKCILFCYEEKNCKKEKKKKSKKKEKNVVNQIILNANFICQKIL